MGVFIYCLVILFGVLCTGTSISIETKCGSISSTTHSLACCVCDSQNLHQIEYSFPNDGNPEHLPYRYDENVTAWPDLCSWAFDVAGCLEKHFPNCSYEVGEDILKDPEAYWILPASSEHPCPSCAPGEYSNHDTWDRLLNFYSRACSKGKLKPSISKLVDGVGNDLSLTCANGKVRRNMRRCLSLFAMEVKENPMTYRITPERQNANVYKLSSSVLNCMFTVINHAPCNKAEKILLYKVSYFQLPSFLDDSKLTSNTSIEEDLASTGRCTIGVHGDLLLNVCWLSDHVACSAPGLKVFVSNKYFVIKGRSQIIERMSLRLTTVLKSINITFHSIDGGRTVAEYSVSEGELKSTFTSPVTSVAGKGADQVEITKYSETLIGILQKGSGAIIFLRVWKDHYFFTLRMAENVLISSDGLLIEGCPKDQVISLEMVPFSRERSVTESDCITNCWKIYGESNTRYVQTCIFQCFIEDEPHSVLASSIAQDEMSVRSFDSQAVRDVYKDWSNGAAITSSRYFAMWSLLLCLCLCGI